MLSAVPLGTREEDVNLYEPVWDVDFCAPDYRFQTPLTRLELILFDGTQIPRQHITKTFRQGDVTEIHRVCQFHHGRRYKRQKSAAILRSSDFDSVRKPRRSVTLDPRL